MTINFNEIAELPHPIGFCNNPLERDAENRDEATLASALADAESRYFLFAGNQVLIRKDDNPAASFSAEEIKPFTPQMDKIILLGTHEGCSWLAVPTPIDVETLEEPWVAYDLRALLYSSSVSQEEVGMIAQANSLLHWNAQNQFCGKCGTASSQMIGGYRRDCPNCENKIFPRTDPCVIMLAIKDDKCLMGRSPHFPEGWVSTLAGFVEPGETIEDAVRRETFEESGIKIGRVKYFASQPWPFPHSLMIGAHCEALSDEINMDESELEDCRWFSRDDVKLMIRDEHPEGLKCPPSKAIASALIQAWAEKT